METRISEVADGIYRLSTFVPEIAPPAGFTFNQFLVLGVAQHAGGQLRVAPVPVVERAQAGAQAFAPVRDRPPGLRVRQRVALRHQARAGEEEAPLVGEVGVQGVPLNAGPLGHHAEAGERRPDAAVQLDGGLHDASLGVGLPLGAALQRVGPGHSDFTAL